MTLTVERLRELLQYDPYTGVFKRVVSRRCYGGGGVIGSRAGSFNRSRGYVIIGIDGRKYAAHRLAWLYVYDRPPIGQIDHINGLRTDNRLSNLRECSNGENQQNLRRARSNSLYGLLGVHFDKRNNLTRPWRAQIKVKGRMHHLGRFATKDEAHAAYVAAKKELHPFYIPTY